MSDGVRQRKVVSGSIKPTSGENIAEKARQGKFRFEMLYLRSLSLES